MTKVLRNTIFAILTAAALTCLSLISVLGLGQMPVADKETAACESSLKSVSPRVSGMAISSWSGLTSALVTGGEYYLISNITAEGCAYVDYQQNAGSLTLDLNGYTIRRNSSTSKDDGCVFKVNSGHILIIKDSGSSGAIAGGNTTGAGGGVFVAGKFIFQGGTIKENKSVKQGSGIYVQTGGILEMSGGNISGNQTVGDSYGWGGGIGNEGTVIISGGNISNNSADYGGGIWTHGPLEMKGNLRITGNSAQILGGGICYTEASSANQSIKLSGNVNITGNSCKGVVSNIALETRPLTISSVFSGNVGIYFKSYFTPANRPTVAAAANAAYLADYNTHFSVDNGKNALYLDGANLKAAKYSTITYSLDGASWASGYTAPDKYFEGNSLTLPVGSNMTATAAAGKTKVFKGWYKDAGHSEKVESITAQDTGDKQLFAWWEELTLVVLDESAVTRETYDGFVKPYTLTGLHKDIGNFTIEYRSGSGAEFLSAVPTDAGTYDVKITRARDGSYEAYEKTVVGGLVIAKAAIQNAYVTITGWTYNDTAAAPVLSNNTGGGQAVYYYLGTANDGTQYAETNTVVPDRAGEYKLRAVIPETANYLGATTADCSFTIARADFRPEISLSGRTYGQPAASPQVTSNPSGGQLIFHYTGTTAAGENYDSSTAPDRAGSYYLGVSIAQSPNYRAFDERQYLSFVVERKELTLVWGAAEHVYDGGEYIPSAAIADLGAIVDGDTVNIVSLTADRSSVEPGDYIATAALNNSNYKLTNPSLPFKIVKVSVTPQAQLEGWVYGSPNAPAVTGNEAGTEVTYYYEGRNGTVYPRSTVAPSDAGDYTVQAEIAASEHYEAAVTEKTEFTISPKIIEIIWTEDDFIYDGSDRQSEVTAAYLNIDGARVALTVTGSEFKDAAGGVVFAASFGGGETNYALPSVSVKTYTMRPADMTDVSVGGYEGIYDGQNHSPVAGVPSVSTTGGQTAVWSFRVGGEGDFAGLGDDKLLINTAGAYTVYYKITAPNHTDYAGSFTARITKKTFAAPGLADRTYTYDGTEHIVELDDKYDSSMMNVSGDRFTKAGVYDVVITLKDPVNFKWENSLSERQVLTWIIDKAVYDMSKVTFPAKTVNENGEVQTLKVGGVLPAGVTVSYFGGYKTLPGVYTVTARFTGDFVNYRPIDDMQAKLTILARQLIYEKDGFGEQSAVAVIESGIHPDVRLTVTDLQQDETTKVTVKRGDYGRVAQAYDLRLVNGSLTVQPEGRVAVRLLIDERMRSRKDLKVYYIGPDGTVTDMNATREGDYLVFTAEHFSTYAIAYTGLLWWEIALIVAGVLLAILIIYLLTFFLLYRHNRLYGRFWDGLYLPLGKLLGVRRISVSHAESAETYSPSAPPSSEQIGQKEEPSGRQQAEAKDKGEN